jgi:putative ABC transport system permease protein
MGGQDVVVVDEVMAERYWPGADPIGKRITFDSPSDSASWIDVVGVVAHTAQEGLDAERRVQLYFSYRQAGIAFMSVAVRTTGDPNAAVPEVRRALTSVDADLPLANVSTMERLVADSMGSRRLSTALLGLFSALALLLAAIGIYGVIAHSVTQRTRELGVRMALGAGRPDVLRLVMTQGASIAAIGLVIGLGGAFALTRLMRSQLYQVDATDPVTFTAVAAVLVTVALLATLLPALRAMRLNPVQALRQD